MSCNYTKSFKNKTTNIVTVSYSFTQFSTLAKIHTTTAREPSMYVCILLRTLKQINAFVNEQYSEKQINSVKIKWINLNNVFKCQSDEL